MTSDVRMRLAETAVNTSHNMAWARVVRSGWSNTKESRCFAFDEIFYRNEENHLDRPFYISPEAGSELEPAAARVTRARSILSAILFITVAVHSTPNTGLRSSSAVSRSASSTTSTSRKSR